MKTIFYFVLAVFCIFGIINIATRIQYKIDGVGYTEITLMELKSIIESNDLICGDPKGSIAVKCTAMKIMPYMGNDFIILINNGSELNKSKGGDFL